MMTTEGRVTGLEQQVSAVTAKVDMLIQEMRDRDNQRAAEIMEIRQRQDAAQAKHDADMKEMNARFDAKFDKLSDQIHTMTIAAVVGFGAIAAAVGGLVFAAFK